MYLKRIELYGFKSFSSKGKIEFEPGISCIVGPNGSGKSNIADAVRWVLGESNARSIRGNRMEDVIFSGTASRRPLGAAEVTVVLDNADSYLPLPFSEISVTRRALRGGGSEYYINEAPCRLRDIHDLFVDTGIGLEGLSLINQGRINELVAARPEERRALVEEAAGIVKYRDRKAEASRKLAETERHLERVGDIIGELETRVEPLREQAERAQQFLDLQHQADDLEIGVSVKVLTEANDKIAEIDAGLQEREEATLAAESKRLAIAAEAEQLRLNIAARGEAVAAAGEEYYALQTRREHEEGELKLARERLENNAGQSRRIAEELAAGEEAAKGRAQEISSLTQQIETLTEELARQSELIAGGEGGSQDLADYLARLDEEAAALRQELNRVGSELAKAGQSGSLLTEQAEKTRQSLREATAEEESVAAELARLTADREEAEAEKARREEASRQAAAALNENQLAAGVASQQVQELAAEEAERRFRCHSLETRVNLLSEMAAGYEGFFPGVKGLLAARAKGEGPRGIVGVMAELMEVPADLRVAVEAYLGANIQNIVCENTASARAAVDFLKSRRLGRATFLPLDELKPRRAQDMSKALTMRGVRGRASELVSVESRLRPALDFLLNNVLIAEDMESALRAAKALDFRCSVVTLEGDTVNPGASISGGSRSAKAGELLAKKARVEEAKTELSAAQSELKQAEAELSAARAEAEKIRSEGEALADRVRESSLRLQETLSRLSEAQVRAEALAERREALQRDLTRLQGELNYLEDAAAESEADAARLKEEEEKAREQLTAKEEARAAAAARLADSRRDMTEQKVAAAAGREKLQALQAACRRLAQEQEDAAWEQEDKSDLLSELDKAKEQLTRSVAACEGEIQSLSRHMLELGDKLESDREGLAAENERQRELELAEKEQNQIREKLSGETHQLQLRRERWQADFENEAAKLAEKFQLDLPRAQARVGETPARTVLISRLNQTRKEMAALGEINPGSIAEYKEVSERYAFLTGQRDDMVEAKANLNSVIAEMDGIMTGRFRDAFRRLSAAFDGSFRRLFGGGSAAMVMSEPEAPLTTGVELRVDLPGKRVANYNLLSGGEKSLIGIALMFAMLEVRQVPFCIMDEVDAALDEANIDRFTAYLQDKSGSSQFVMISHRQSTMEAANALWGVTMEEEGVSKVISVRLTQALAG